MKIDTLISVYSQLVYQYLLIVAKDLFFRYIRFIEDFIESRCFVIFSFCLEAAIN